MNVFDTFDFALIGIYADTTTGRAHMLSRLQEALMWLIEKESPPFVRLYLMFKIAEALHCIAPKEASDRFVEVLNQAQELLAPFAGPLDKERRKHIYDHSRDYIEYVQAWHTLRYKIRSRDEALITEMFDSD